MLIASALYISAVLPQTITIPSDNLFCFQTWPRSQNGFGGFAEIETDKAYHQVASRLTVSTSELKVVWTGRLGKINVNGSPASLTVNSLSLPENIAFPITLEVLADGASAGHFAFKQASTRIVNFEKYLEARRLGKDTLLGTTLPGVEIPTIKLKAIWRTAALTIVVADRHGSRAYVKDLPLPDWKLVANLSATSFFELERNRVAKECRPVYRTIIYD